MSNVYPLQHQIDLTQLYWYMSLIQSILLWSYIIKLTHQSNNTNQYNRKQILHTVGFTIPYVLNKFTFYLLPYNSLHQIFMNYSFDMDSEKGIDGMI